MKLETEYSMDDKVYFVYEENGYEIEKCDMCGGKGKLKIEKKNLRVTCPRCNGSGKGSHKKHKYFSVVGSAIIIGVRVDKCRPLPVQDVDYYIYQDKTEQTKVVPEKYVFVKRIDAKRCCDELKRKLVLDDIDY